MTVQIDPEQNEVRALKRVADWRRKRVVEIGCGDGRLTLRLAKLGAVVHAIDPDAGLIRAARRNRPRQFVQLIRYQVGEAERLNQQDESFDLAVFAWAL